MSRPEYPHPLVISIESRKGGVGKTTAALNLADVLCRKKRTAAVLVLDVDVTGTNVTDGLDSGYWRKKAHTVQAVPGGKNRNANLLEIFAQQFMRGDGAPPFVVDGQASRGPSLVVKPAQTINVIGSSIQRAPYSKDAPGADWLRRPDLLFDELHSFWFLEFVRELIYGFAGTIARFGRAGRSCVILDNSSGFVGLVPAIEEWLTDLGPREGKFLTVSSLDSQDLVACGDAITRLHGLYRMKWSTSREFHQAKTGLGSERTASLGEAEKRFFLRLAETEASRTVAESSPLTAARREPLEFYLCDADTVGSQYAESLGRYQGLILNRVPQAVLRDDSNLVFRYAGREDGEIWTGLLGSSRSDARLFFVPHDEYIEHQFSGKQLRRIVDDRGRHVSAVIRGTWLPHLPQEPGAFTSLAHPMSTAPRSGVWFGQLVGDLQRLQDALRGAADSLVRNGMGDLALLVRDEWYPRGWSRSLAHRLRSLIAATGTPFVESSVREIGAAGSEGITASAYGRLFRHAYVTAGEMAEEVVPLVERFLPSLMASALLATGPLVWEESSLAETLGSALGVVAATEAVEWERTLGKEVHARSARSARGMVSFLAEESRAKRQFKKVRGGERRRVPARELPHLYRACAYSQARLLDCPADTRFLLLVLVRLAEFREGDDAVVPSIRDIVEPVVVGKTRSHEEGEKRLRGALFGASSMRDFQDVLRRVIARWEGDL